MNTGLAMRRDRGRDREKERESMDRKPAYGGFMHELKRELLSIELQ